MCSASHVKGGVVLNSWMCERTWSYFEVKFHESKFIHSWGVIVSFFHVRECWQLSLRKIFYFTSLNKVAFGSVAQADAMKPKLLANSNATWWNTPKASHWCFPQATDLIGIEGTHTVELKFIISDAFLKILKYLASTWAKTVWITAAFTLTH